MLWGGGRNVWSPTSYHRPTRSASTLSFFQVSVLLVLSASVLVSHVEGLWCDRAPAGVNVPKMPGDSGYRIVISGDPDKPDKYIPEAVYTVRIQGPGDQYSVKKFSGFLLVAEPADGLSHDTSAGSFQLVGDSLARFSEYCPHAVKHASELPKAEVQVRWTAPPATAGCVSFRATIIKNKGQWFMDEGELTKTLCPETDVGPDEQETTDPCCACDEAKYELTFEGLWSALTHPKDFPADAWSAHFSDIIGASHAPDFRFWKKDMVASEGVKQMAEIGDSKELESELKTESGSIRTIIKARGLRHPNFYGHKTFAVFRADKDHNLISLVSKIAPSPDWFVGVSGLNLCLKNCSWMEEKQIPLYPWDAGTDSGVTYLSPREPTIPRDRILGITWQEDDRSPFYDPSGNMVKPFARIRITKQRSYDTSCPERMEKNNGVDYDEDDQYDDMDDSDRPECEMTDWSMWSTCSSAATCGRGVQKSYRNYKNEAKAIDLGCNRKRTRERVCDVPCGGGGGSGGSVNYDSGYVSRSNYGRPRGGSSGSYPVDPSDPCAVTEFHAWRGCSVTCGQGIKRRFREYLSPDMARSHGCDSSILVETERCMGAYANCGDAEEVKPGCETTDWTEWGPCDATCGKGIQIRTRRYVFPPPHTDCRVELYEDQSCEGMNCTSQEICTQPVDLIKCRGSYTKWHYDVGSQTCRKFSYGGCGGTQNIFESKEDCEKTCGSITELPSDSMVGYHHHSRVPTYSNNYPHTVNNNNYPHNNNNPIHHSLSPYSSHSSPPINSRYQPQNTSPYSSSNSYQNYGPVYSPSDERTTLSSIIPSRRHGPSSSSPYSSSYGSPVDCEVSDWTPWSICSVACGRGHKYRTRYIKHPPQNGGTPCPHLEHKRKCKGVQCPNNSPYGYHHHNSNHHHHQQQYTTGGFDGYIN